MTGWVAGVTYAYALCAVSDLSHQCARWVHSVLVGQVMFQSKLAMAIKDRLYRVVCVQLDVVPMFFSMVFIS